MALGDDLARLKLRSAAEALQRHLAAVEISVGEDELDEYDSEQYGRHFGYLSGLQSAADIVSRMAENLDAYPSNLIG